MLLYSLVLAHFVTWLGSKVPRGQLSPGKCCLVKDLFGVGTGLAVWTWPTELAWFLFGIVGTVVAVKDLHDRLAGLRLGGDNRPQAIGVDCLHCRVYT